MASGTLAPLGYLLLWGLIATVAMTSILEGSRGLGFSRMSLPFLVGLEIEIVHRRPADNIEAVSINLQAKPSFEAFGQYLKTANPFEFWFRAVEMVWLPWVGIAHTLILPWALASTQPKLRLGFDSKAGADNAQG